MIFFVPIKEKYSFKMFTFFLRKTNVNTLVKTQKDLFSDKKK